MFEGNSFEEDDEDMDGISDADFAAMEEIKDYSHRPAIEYDPEKHYKWPENFVPDKND